MLKQDCSPVYQRVAIPFWQRGYHTLVGVNYGQALNCSEDAPSTTINLGAQLRQAANAMKFEAIDDNGNVDYRKLRDTEAYQSFQRLTWQLHRFPLDSLKTRDQKLAFWINIFNVLVIDSVIQFGIKKTVHEKTGFFVKAAYIIGGYRFSMDDIEHGILRNNQGNPAIPGPQFSPNDPRTALVIKPFDPRIHFTLVCGAKSCPPIGFYRDDNIDQQLDLATANFFSSEVEVDLTAKRIALSQIFRWFAPDFGGSLLNQAGQGNFTSVLRFIAQHTSDEDVRLALTEEAQAFKVSFKHYDWGLNILH